MKSITVSGLPWTLIRLYKSRFPLPKAKLIKELMFQESSDRLTAENVQNCELMRRLKRNARKSKTKMPVL